jgi:hypothetical protein
MNAARRSSLVNLLMLIFQCGVLPAVDLGSITHCEDSDNEGGNPPPCNLWLQSGVELRPLRDGPRFEEFPKNCGPNVANPLPVSGGVDAKFFGEFRWNL